MNFFKIVQLQQSNFIKLDREKRVQDEKVYNSGIFLIMCRNGDVHSNESI